MSPRYSPAAERPLDLPCTIAVPAAAKNPYDFVLHPELFQLLAKHDKFVFLGAPVVLSVEGAAAGVISYPLVQRGFAHPVPQHQLPGRRAGFLLRHHLFLEFMSIFGFLLLHFSFFSFSSSILSPVRFFVVLFSVDRTSSTETAKSHFFFRTARKSRSERNCSGFFLCRG